MRKSVDSALRFGCKGIKVRVSGRLNGNEIARSEWYLQGTSAAAHAARGHRLRLFRGAHDLRCDRCKGVGLSRPISTSSASVASSLRFPGAAAGAFQS